MNLMNLMNLMKRFLAGLALAIAVSFTAFAQQAVVSRDVNLRPTPSNVEPSIKLLHPPQRLTLLGPNPTGGYYHVQATAGPGWVWGRNVKFPAEAANSTTTPSAPPPGPPPP